MTSSKFPLLSALLIGLVLGAGAGFFAGRSSSHGQEESTVNASSNVLKLKAQAGGLEATDAGELNGEELKPRPGTLPITSAALSAELLALEQAGFSGRNNMRKFADLQDRLRVSDIAAIAAEMAAAPSSPARDSGFHLVMSVFAEKNPQAAWNLALGIKTFEARQNALMSVASTVAAKDPSRVLDMVDHIQDAQMKRQIRSMAIFAIAQKDPQRALDLAINGATPGDSEVSMIFSNWARKDLEGAKAAIARLNGRAAEQARMALISSLARKDPQAAWDYALTLPSSGDSFQDARVQVITNWAQSDPQSALKAALSMSESGARTSAISSAVSAWSRNDFNGALQYAIGIDDSTMRSDILRAMSSNPSGNRKELLNAVLDHMPPGDSFQQTVTSIFSSWAMENPAEAAAAITQLPPGRSFSIAVGQIASQWMRSGRNKQEVFDWVRQLPESEGRRNAVQSVFSEWSGENPQDALKALNNLPVNDRKQAVQALASGWGRKDPQAVLQWASSLNDPAERNTVTGNAVSQWASSSPESAAHYVESLPEANRAVAMQAVVNSWASKDTQAAAEWLRSQPVGASKDGAVTSLSWKISQEDPETALAWAATISDASRRSSQMERLARDWIRQDAATARVWISKSQLPEETRKQLLK